VAHLPVREPQNQPGVIDLTSAFQHCVQRAYFKQRIADVLKLITAVGGGVILVLLRLWQPAAGATTYNTIVLYSITGVAFLVSLASSLNYAMNFEREAGKYETAARAVRLLRDRYELELQRDPNNPVWVRSLGVWGKQHVYRIETLLENAKVFDVYYDFHMTDPEMPQPAPHSPALQPQTS
jgi:hypothetical protein